MLFLIMSPSEIYAYTAGRFEKIKKFDPCFNDLVCGFYREDFVRWYGKKVNFFDLAPYFSPEEDIQTLQEFIELCLEKGLISENGKTNKIAYARGLLYSTFDWLSKDDPEVWEDQSFYGGRTEYYTTRARGNIIYYDINSAYAFALCQPLPVRESSKHYRYFPLSGLDRIKSILEDGKHVLCRAEVYVEDWLPPIPYRVKGKDYDQTFFPVGTLEGWFHAEDLLGLEWCDRWKIKVHEYIAFEKRVHEGLRELVLSLYEERKGASRARKVFLKHTLVQLYGLIGWKQKGFPKNRLVGGYVTAFVRYYHYSAMRRAEKYGRLLYCDTDSFFLESNNHVKVQTELGLGKRLGQWGIRKQVKELQVLGYKRYVIKGSDGQSEIIFSGDRVDKVDDQGRLYKINPYTGRLDPVTANPQEVPKRRILEDGSTYPWILEELAYALEGREGASIGESQAL